MSDIAINGVYVVASVLFIFGLKLLSSPGTARKGNLISALGMLLAVVVTLLKNEVISFQWIIVGGIVGALVGVLAARLVAMTAMPEMVALFNGSGGIASLLVAWGLTASNLSIFTLFVTFLAILIGGVTFTGSVVAWGKLSGKMPSRPITYGGQQVINLLLLAFLFYLGASFVWPPLSFLSQGNLVIAIALLAGVLGVLVVIPIGGADMPVVISLLNSYSGLAACAAGFAIESNILIVAGALVGASGIILTSIMCRAMNRSLVNVLFSGFGAGEGKAGQKSSVHGEIKSANVEDAFLMLEAADKVVFIPGYGMAVAQAQHAVKELMELLESTGVEVEFAIHPVAGRMPGHMNVLLAEANIPYDKLREMDDINPQMGTVGVAVVIGANDVVNPAAHEDEGSPIYGMPIIHADHARVVIVLKRSMNTGFAGIDNPLFFKENTRMLFGDAKVTIQALVGQFKS